MAYLRIIPLFFLVLTLAIGCSAHCDDEDYRKEQKQKNAIVSDSLKVNP